MARLHTLKDIKKYLEEHTANVSMIISAPRMCMVHIKVSCRLTDLVQEMVQSNVPHHIKVKVERMTWWERLTNRGIKVWP